MAILKKEDQKPVKLQIDLTGPQGNAYFLLGQVNKFAKQLGLDENKIQEEMKASDYENLIQVFDKYFGDFVDLIK